MHILEGPPTLDEYEALYDSTGWAARKPVTRAQLAASLDQSWLWVRAVEDDRVVGVGRVVSEGTLYGLVCDLIVAPEHQGRGIGSALIQAINECCRQAGLRRVWLFAAQDKAGFYERNGYETRPADMPGMQLVEE